MPGVTKVKKKHKIISTTPIDFRTNDRVILLETDYTYTIVKLERLVSSEYAQVYGLTYNDTIIPKAVSLE